MRKRLIQTLSRRKFIRNSVIAAAGTALAPTLLTSCEDEFEPEGTYGFFEGVASFDPAQTNVILWTRYTPANNENNPEIILDVATNETFSSDAVVASQTVLVDTANDNTINVDVSGLTSNTTYYYRFRNEKTEINSVVGQTKTLPAMGEITQVKVAVVSCANFQAGLFNVYGAIALSDADIVVHLGDYIYEYGEGGYGSTADTATLGRVHEPTGEIISLEDYRTRYRQYRGDVQLQEAHRLKPFICVWDDHEITNNAYKDGAENHQADEGSYEERKTNALQAWHEYLPARVTDNAKIYRSFNLGGIAELFMLDTRIIGRDEQLDYASYFNSDGSLDAVGLATDWQSATRTILGTEQRDWLTGAIAGSSATWQVLGSQVLFGKYMIPAELLVITAQLASSPTTELLTQYQTLLTELVTIKLRILQGDPTVTTEERARVETVLPYNLDAWDGYPAEREMILASAMGKNLVALAGDTHNAWHTDLTNATNDRMGVEFATASVSSPGFEAILGSDAATLAAFAQANAVLIDDLQYLDPSQRGFMTVTFTNSAATSEWHFIGTLTTEDTSTTLGHTAVETI